MNSRMRTAIRDALALVRKANVTAATSVIRAALSGTKLKPEKRQPVPAPKARRKSATPASERKPLGDVLRTLREFRSAPPIKTAKPTVGKKRQPPGTDSNFTMRSYAHAGGHLAYMLYVPPRLEGRDLSLVLMLHGCSQNPQDFATGTQMNRLADEFGLIVAYPHQPRSANASGCWNWFDGRHQYHGSGEPAMLAGLAKALAGEFKIDANQVFAAGLSAGGAMAEILASTYPRQFTAVGIHSGLPYGAASSVMTAFGAMKGSSKVERKSAEKNGSNSRRIIFHGESDTTVHPSNGERIAGRARGSGKKPVEIASTSEINGRMVTRTILENGDAYPMTEHWVVKGGGHAWFGGNSQGSYTDTKGPDSSREMVRFFLRK